MIEIGNYSGTLDDLQAFVTGVWCREYDGRMSFPLWTRDYFRWQFAGPQSSPPQLLAAYDDGRLVGTLLGLRCTLTVGGGSRQGLLSSWLSIDADYRGRGLVNDLKSSQLRDHEQAGGDVILSYRYVGSRFSRAAGPTAKQQRDQRWSSRRIGFWARALDSRRLGKWTLRMLDRYLTHVGAMVIPAPRATASAVHIRDFRAEDLPQCLHLLTQSANRFDLSINWTSDRLSRQLDGCGVGRSLVAYEAGEVRGFISYHVLPFSARSVEPVGIIDLIALDELAGRDQRALVNSALVRMRDEGAILALKLRTGDVAATTMMLTGFFARPTDSYEMIHWLQNPHSRAIHGRQQLLWR